MMIVTRGSDGGRLRRPRKTAPPSLGPQGSCFPTLIGQHQGLGERQIDLAATLAELGHRRQSRRRSRPCRQQATCPASAEVACRESIIPRPLKRECTAEKTRRLGLGENTPGTLWAYNNWDHNVLTTIFEKRTGRSVAGAFDAGIANPLDLRDFTPEAVSYLAEPALSQHRAAMFWMSARDLARFGALYLEPRVWSDGERVLPAAWIDRITSDFTETGIGGLAPRPQLPLVDPRDRRRGLPPRNLLGLRTGRPASPFRHPGMAQYLRASGRHGAASWRATCDAVKQEGAGPASRAGEGSSSPLFRCRRLMAPPNICQGSPSDPAPRVRGAGGPPCRGPLLRRCTGAAGSGGARCHSRESLPRAME